MKLFEDKRPNLAKWIESAADGEPIEGVTVGDFHSFIISLQPGKLMTWSEARPLLDYEFGEGYGRAECHPICAWTKSRVIFVAEYDGSTSIAWYPRNPVDCMPGYDGMANT